MERPSNSVAKIITGTVLGVVLTICLLLFCVCCMCFQLFTYTASLAGIPINISKEILNR